MTLKTGYVLLYLGKNVVLDIACFSCCLKIVLEKIFLLQRDYADYKEFLCNCLESIVMCFLSSRKLILMRKSYTKRINKFNEAEIGGVA